MGEKKPLRGIIIQKVILYNEYKTAVNIFVSNKTEATFIMQKLQEIQNK